MAEQPRTQIGPDPDSLCIRPTAPQLHRFGQPTSQPALPVALCAFTHPLRTAHSNPCPSPHTSSLRCSASPLSSYPHLSAYLLLKHYLSILLEHSSSPTARTLPEHTAALKLTPSLESALRNPQSATPTSCSRSKSSLAARCPKVNKNPT